MTVNDAKIKTYLNVGDGQVNVSPCRIIAPFENKNQLDFKSQKILDEERRSRKIHERGRRGNDRSRPSDTGTGNREGNGKNHSEVFSQIKYRQTDRQEGVDSEEGQAGITKNFFFFASFPNREIWDVLYLRKKECDAVLDVAKRANFLFQ